MERVIGTLMNSSITADGTSRAIIWATLYLIQYICLPFHFWTCSHWVTKSIGLLDHTDYSGNECIFFLIASSPVTENGSGTYHEVLFWPSEDMVNNPTLFKRGRILREILNVPEVEIKSLYCTMLKIRHCFSDPICFIISRSGIYSKIYNKGRTELHSAKVDARDWGKFIQ